MSRARCQSGGSRPTVFHFVLGLQSSCTSAPPPPPLPPGEKGFKPELVPGTKTGVSNPLGFPTLKTMAHDISHTEMRGAAINVFGSASKKDSLIIALRSIGEPGLAAAVAQQVLGQKVYVKWPYLQVRSAATRPHCVCRAYIVLHSTLCLSKLCAAWRGFPLCWQRHSGFPCL